MVIRAEPVYSQTGYDVICCVHSGRRAAWSPLWWWPCQTWSTLSITKSSISILDKLLLTAPIADMVWKLPAAQSHCEMLVTRSSPQWRSGRSTTPRNVLNLLVTDLRPLGLGYLGFGVAHSVARTWVPIAPVDTHDLSLTALELLRVI